MEKKIFSPREQVKDFIRQGIAAGVLTQGNMVPSEILISEQLNLSRGTVRTALEELELAGVLQKRNHRRYVADGQRKRAEIRELVLVVGTSVDDPCQFRNTGFALAVQAGIMDALSERSKSVVSLHMDNINLQDVEVLVQLRPEGAILTQKVLMSELGEPVLHRLKEQEIPCVLEYMDERYAENDCVLYDHESGNYELTRYALALGCRNIMCFYPDNTREYWFNARHRGYRRAMNEAGLTPYPGLKTRPFKAEYDHTRETFDLAVRLNMGFLCEYFSGLRPPDCIMANSDWEASFVAAACRALGKEPNRDVMIMGFDNKIESNPWMKFEPVRPMATLDKHNTQLGRMLCDTLFERIAGVLPPEPVLRMMKMDLVKLQ